MSDAELARDIAAKVRGMWTDRDPLAVAAELGLAAGRAGLTWTATPPTAEGQYWVRNRAVLAGVVVLIEDVEGNLWIDDDGELARYLRQFPEAEWAGPIPAPQEPT